MENSLAKEVIKQTLGYYLESLVPQEDGTFKHLHSLHFLDEHPERKDSPEFTEEELLNQIELIKAAAKIF